MDLFRIINDIAAETRMNMREKVNMLIRILVGISPKRIECRRRTGPEDGGYPGTKSAVEAEKGVREAKTAGAAVTPRQDIQ